VADIGHEAALRGQQGFQTIQGGIEGAAECANLVVFEQRIGQALRKIIHLDQFGHQAGQLGQASEHLAVGKVRRERHETEEQNAYHN